VSGSLSGLFFTAAGNRPRSTAIDDGQPLTYELAARRVAGFAQRLEAELPHGSRVGLLLPKGADAIVAMLGSLAARMSYVPIDPAAPPARQKQIVLNAGIRALVAVNGVPESWRGDDEQVAPLLELGPEETRVQGDPEPYAMRTFDANAEAYVLHTSGSTGVPKGVVITQENAASFVRWAVEHFVLSALDRMAVHAPLHFDLPVLDVFAGLSAGATVCPIPEQTVLFPAAVRTFLYDQRITVLYAVPSAYVALLERGGLESRPPALRLALYAGEEFHVPALRRLARVLAPVAIHNLYGPVETNVVCARDVRTGDLFRDHVPIGEPIAGTEIRLRAADCSVVSARGEEGEICVRGPGVSPGYLTPEGVEPKRVELEVAGEVHSYYPTGDWASYDPECALTLLGRRDGMIKTRGFRVEIGDVEAALAQHDRIGQVAVYPVDADQHTKVLNAAVVPRVGEQLDAGEVIRWARHVLPGYMVPAQVVVVERLQHTSTGKVDRAALAHVAQEVAAR
jgi:L-proline---[L-prolyl-carrier protein] ligase